MRPETRDLAAAKPQCLNVSLSPQVSCLWSQVSPCPSSPHPRRTMQVSGEATMPWQAAMHTP